MLTTTPIPGVILLRMPTQEDERGSFSRLYCQASLEAVGIDFPVRQTSLSRSRRRGTLRGLHWSPGEAKLVRCVAGAIFDVAVDLRPGSPTRHRWFGVALEPSDDRALLVPAGCAHGLLTLTDDAAVLYHMNRDHDPGQACGARWDDPALSIDWPFAPEVISARDAAWAPIG